MVVDSLDVDPVLPDDEDGVVDDDGGDGLVDVDELDEPLLSRVVVPGEADGEVVLRSPTLSLRSVQPLRTPAASASAHRPVSNFCIADTSSVEWSVVGRLQWGCRRAAG